MLRSCSVAATHWLKNMALAPRLAVGRIARFLCVIASSELHLARLALPLHSEFHGNCHLQHD
jgi:hypothetical protein